MSKKKEKSVRELINQDTCWGCRKRVNICLDCPRKNRYGQIKLSALNRVRHMIADREALPYFPINPTN